MLTLVDHYLKRDPSDRVAEIKKQSDTAVAKHAEEMKKAEQLHQPDAKLPADADKLAGTWTNAWLGDAIVAYDKGALSFKLAGKGDLAATLAPWHDDTFLARWSDRRLGNALVTFVRRPNDGTAERVKLSPLTGSDAMLAGTDFTRAK
jgi:hypothetical protein